MHSCTLAFANNALVVAASAMNEEIIAELHTVTEGFASPLGSRLGGAFERIKVRDSPLQLDLHARGRFDYVCSRQFG